MFEISAGGGGGTRSSDLLNAGHPGSLTNRLGDALQNASAAGVYRDIDNAFGAGPDGNGSIQNGTRVDVSQFSYEKPHKRKKANRDSGGSSGGSHHSSAKRTWDYYEAPLAEKYHFGKATAYQEALANTARRREMEDMRRAGLNPSVIYGSHSSSGADSSIFPQEASSGGSGGSGGSPRRYGGRRTNNHIFSGGAYYGLMAAAGLIAAVVTHNAGVGMATSGLVGTALKAINGFFKR